MLSVTIETVLLLVNAFLNTLETHMLHADQNVWSTQIVPLTKHARGTNILTLALVPVESMHNAMSGII